MKPRTIIAREGVFRCAAAPAILFGRSLEAERASVTRPLHDPLSSRFGLPVVPTAAGRQLPATPYILIGEPQDHPALHKLVADHRAQLPKGGLDAEGYVLDISPERVLIAASKPAGAYYGVLKLLEMDTTAGKGLEIPADTLVDWPDMGWRGIHVIVGSRADLPAVETLLTRDMPRYRLNRLILEINYRYRFTSHPEVIEGDALTQDDCHRLKSLADLSFVRLIPMINCLGHQSWAENTSQLLKSHPEFDETPDAPADNKGLYCRSWCPSNPEVIRLVCDLADELIDAFHADAFHVGMDEVFLLGQCARCKGQDPAHLFAKAVNDLHSHLVKRRRVQMLMWGDRLLDGKATGYGEWEASENGTAPAIDLIPKDIVICDWHYELRYNDAPATYPSVALFQEKGLRVWPSSWRSAENARRLAAASLQGRTDRMLGYLATTWVGVQGLVGALATEPQPTSERGAAGVAAAIDTGSRIAWEGITLKKGY